MDASETEQRILRAALTVFERDGFLGARMQVIADEAGISKAALHYHFRNKEKLFDRIFDDYTARIIPLVGSWDDGTDDWRGQVRRFVKELMHLFSESSLLFMAQELHRDPKKLEPRMQQRRKAPNRFVDWYGHLRSRGLVRNTDPHAVLTAMQSLCAYPSMNPRMLAGAMRMNKQEYGRFMASYPDHVADMLIRIMEK